MSDIRKYFLLRTIVTTIFGVLFGVLLLLLAPYGSELFEILLIAIGLLTAVVNLPTCWVALRAVKQRGEWINLVLGLLSVLLGVAMMLLPQSFLLLLMAFYALLLPAARVILVEKHAKQAKRELFHLITGISLVIIYLADAQSYVLTYAAITCFVAFGLYFLYGILAFFFRYDATPKAESQPQDPEK